MFQQDIEEKSSKRRVVPMSGGSVARWTTVCCNSWSVKSRDIEHAQKKRGDAFVQSEEASIRASNKNARGRGTG
jgi:hypothetical protein